MYEIQHSLGCRTQPNLVSTQMRPGLIPFSPPRDTFAYNGLSSLNTRCSEPFIYSSIHQSRLRLRWSATVNNTQLERAEIVRQMIINRSEVLIHWGATSRLALSSMRFNLCLMSRLMTACLRNFFKNSFMKNRLCGIWVWERQNQTGWPENITYLLYKRWKIKARWLAGQNITSFFSLCCAPSVFLGRQRWMNTWDYRRKLSFFSPTWGNSNWWLSFIIPLSVDRTMMS